MSKKKTPRDKIKNVGHKICCSCLVEKPLVFFGKLTSAKDGYRGRCKDCQNAYSRKLYNTDSGRKKKREYAVKNKEKLDEYHKQYRIINREIRNKNQRVYSKNNRQLLNASRRKYIRERLKTDVKFKLERLYRDRLRQALKGRRRVARTMHLLGCELDVLRKHLESLFYDNPKTGESMTWENRGMFGWHIDHIKPLSMFDLENESELRQAMHYTNLQPMWAEENWKKNNKYIGNYR